ncbi:hypothetical protein GCM10007901_23830 [Dyella acidisoli]|uniref:RHS repeat protein n=2 Tax=Dyella acidisoli TaxID=1867834 RepID=A0ABQ5XPX5_9GAMM|nr:hypothetical protein GCM10007901_23830 [Dyella acidisoli]
MTVLKARLGTESAIVRGLRTNGSTNSWFSKFATSFCAFLLVASCNVFAETDVPTDYGGGGGGSGGAMASGPQKLPGVDVVANRAPDVQEQLGAGSVIGMPPPQNVSPPLQVGKTPGSVTTLARITVNGKLPKDDCKKADPISLATGAKVESVTDFARSGEMGLSFTRYYSSNVYNTGSFSSTRAGGWRTSYDYLLFLDVTQGGACNYTSTSSVCPLVLVRPDGTIVQFGPGTAHSDGTASFGELKNGIATMTRNSDGSYVIHDEDSKVLTFSNALYNGTYFTLTSIKDLAGVGWTFAYPDATDVVVSHTSGQTVSLHWTDTKVPDGPNSAYDIVRQLTVVDPAGNSYSYSTIIPYGTIGDMSGTRYLIGELQTATLPLPGGSTSVAYKYKSDAGGAYGFGNYQYALTEVDYNGIAQDLTSYNGVGQAIQDEMADGTQQTNISYGSNSTGPVTTVTNPLGHVSVYQFDANSNILSITGQASVHCAATFSSRTYDANENVQSDTDNDGNITNYTYAVNGEILQKVESPGPFQRVTNFVWDTTPGTDRLLSVTVVGYLQTSFAYTPQGRLASVTQTNLASNGVANQSRTTTYSYSLYPNGMVSAVVTTLPSPSGANTLTYNYDSLGNVTSIVNALGQATSYNNFTGMGLPTTETSANGDVLNYTYAFGRVTSISHTHAGVTNTESINYDPNSGQVSKLVAFDGEVTQYVYDPDFKLTSSMWTGPSGAVISKNYGYDINGDVTTTSYTRKGQTSPDLITHATYDELGRPLVINGNSGQSRTYSYDPNGNVSTVTDAVGNTTTYKYDSVSRLQYIVDTTGKSTLYLYDFGDNPLQITDPRGLTTYYKYDGFGDVWGVTSPDSGTTSYSIDPYGRVTSKTTNNGFVASYTYDTLNRVTAVTAGSQTYTYTYDSCTYGKGKLCAYAGQNGGGSSSLTYSIEGLVATRTDNSFLGSSTTSFSYDGMNRLTQMMSGTAYTVNYAWTDDQITNVNLQYGSQSVNVVSNVIYDAARRPLSWSYGNGITRTQTYDQDERLKSIGSTLGTTTIQSLAYTWDNLDRITAKTDSVYAGTQGFGYDNLNRLTSQTQVAPIFFNYDANGNRTQQSWMTNDTVAIATNSNQIASRGSHAYTYDGNGNRATDSVSGVTTTYTYDGFNRLNSVSRSAALTNCETSYQCPTYPSGTTTYQVNALGQLSLTNGPLGLWMYGYDLDGHLIGELTSSSGVVNANNYIYLNGQPIALLNQIGSGTPNLYYMLDDHTGRPEQITNSGGSVVWRAQNSAFDREVVVEGIADVDVGSPGQVYDHFTGNWSNGFRDYDSSNGRYLESDPLGLAAGVNTYAYAEESPITLADPSGLNPGDIFGSLADASRDAGAYLTTVNGGPLRRFFMGTQFALFVEVPGCPGDYTYVVGSPLTGTAPIPVRTEALSLAEKLALDEAKAGAGARIMAGRIKDPAFPEDVYAKMEHVHQDLVTGENIVIHYWEELLTGVRSGFKFK